VGRNNFVIAFRGVEDYSRPVTSHPSVAASGQKVLISATVSCATDNNKD